MVSVMCVETSNQETTAQIAARGNKTRRRANVLALNSLRLKDFRSAKRC